MLEPPIEILKKIIEMKFGNRRIYRKLKLKITDKIPTCEEEHRNDKEEEEGESVHVCSCCVTLK